MKIRSRFALAAALTAGCLPWTHAPAQEPGKGGTQPLDLSARPAPNDDTVLTFSDEFKGPTLDTSKWNTWVPWPVIINGEKAAYLPDAYDFLPDGGLRLRGEKRPFGEQPFTSCELATDGKFSQAYGYWEMVARVPKGNGFWPAFWIMPSETGKKNGAEIDVMEMLCEDTHKVHTTLHYTGVVSGRGMGYGDASGGADYSDGYHSYAVSWRPQIIVWLIDGKEHFRIEGSQVPSAPEYLIANMAIVGSWPKPVDATTPFPAYMDIRSIRVYQYKDLLKTPTPAPELARGATTVTPFVVKPGAAIDIRSSFTMAAACPSMLVRVYVTDFYGKKFFTEIPKTYQNVPAGVTQSIEGRWTAPTDLPDGVYTVAIKFSSDNPKTDAYLGCASRFEVTASGAVIK